MKEENSTPILRVAVASLNPVKINAAKEAFSIVFGGAVEAIPMAVDSGVSDQPMDFDETHLGAQNRVNKAIKLEQADYYIAFEGGVDVFEDGPKTFAVICISNGEDIIFGQSGTLPLPMSVYEKLLNGIELGTAMDELFNTVNIKQKGGAIGQLTNGLETRMSIYKSATILALSRFINAELYE
ncbi:MAG: inosine/xanthosine triphosphatase [Alphaproteobacteria bacterium]|jgi:inosine/xanthosine triphosphatase